MGLFVGSIGEVAQRLVIGGKSILPGRHGARIVSGSSPAALIDIRAARLVELVAGIGACGHIAARQWQGSSGGSIPGRLYARLKKAVVPASAELQFLPVPLPRQVDLGMD